MGKKIILEAGSIKIGFRLNESESAGRLAEILPVGSQAQSWGNEIYFSIPLELPLEDGREVLEAGDIAFWPTGSAFCIFFGPTPASTDHRPRPVSPVTLLGHIADKRDIEKLAEIGQGKPVKLKLG